MAMLRAGFDLTHVYGLTETYGPATVNEWHEDWTRLRWVVVEGDGSVLETGAEFAHAIDALREKYPQYRAMDLSRESGAVIRIAPTRILAWQAG